MLIDKLGIQSNQYFPIYAFAKIDPSMTKIEKLKNQQKAKLRGILEQTRTKIQEDNISIQDILDSEKYAQTYKQTIITCAILERKIPLEDVERYLKEIVNKCWKTTDYRKLLCAYDFMKYSGEEL